MKRFLVYTVVLISALWVITSLTDTEPEPSISDPVVLSTVGMLDDIVGNLAEGFVDNQLLMPSGTDPHVYIPTLQDVNRLNLADMIFAVGLDLEAQMESALESLSLNKTVLLVGDNLPKDQLLFKERNVYDPHVWFDLDLFAQISENVASALSAEFPDKAALIKERLKLYLNMLNDLDLYASTKLSKIDPGTRWIITTHDAFSYFARKYGFEIFTLQGVSTQSDYSLKDKNDMVDLIISNRIPAVFVEDSVSNKDLLSVIDSVASKSHSVEIGGYLFADSLGRIDSEYSSFESTFRSNVDTIFKALY